MNCGDKMGRNLGGKDIGRKYMGIYPYSHNDW